MARPDLASPPAVLLVAAFLLAALGTSVSIAALVGAGLPAALFLLPVAFSVFQAGATPLLRVSGLYRYHSRMLKATVRTRRTYEIHGGTALDYALHLSWGDRGLAARRRVLAWYLDGILDIAERVARGELPPDVRVTGTSYFFNERSAARLGFRIEPAGRRLKLVLVLSYLDLVVLYSFCRGRLSFPNVLQAKRAVIAAGDLANRRPDIARLRRRLGEPGELASV